MAICKLSFESDGNETTVEINGKSTDLIEAVATTLANNSDIRDIVTIALMFAAKEELTNEGETDEQRTLN